MCECVKRLVMCGRGEEEAAKLCYDFMDMEMYEELEIYISFLEKRELEGCHVERV